MDFDERSWLEQVKSDVNHLRSDMSKLLADLNDDGAPRQRDGFSALQYQINALQNVLFKVERALDALGTESEEAERAFTCVYVPPDVMGFHSPLV